MLQIETIALVLPVKSWGKPSTKINTFKENSMYAWHMKCCLSPGRKMAPAWTAGSTPCPKRWTCDGSSGSLSIVYSFVSFQWTKNRLYPLNPCYIFFLSSCARVWGEDPWSNSRPHSVREMPTHHKAAWVSPKTSLPRTACTPAKTVLNSTCSR